MLTGKYDEAGVDALDRAPAASLPKFGDVEMEVLIDPSGVESIKNLAANGNKKARILLEVNEGKSPVEVGEAYGCSRTYIYYVIEEYSKRGYEYLLVKKGRPKSVGYKRNKEKNKPGRPRGSKKKNDN